MASATRPTRATADELRAWTTLVLARLDPVVEEHGAGPAARPAVLETIATAARERPARAQRLLQLLDDPALAPAWQRHLRYVGLAAGGDVAAEVVGLLRAASVATADAGCPAHGCLRRAWSRFRAAHAGPRRAHRTHRTWGAA